MSSKDVVSGDLGTVDDMTTTPTTTDLINNHLTDGQWHPLTRVSEAIAPALIRSDPDTMLTTGTRIRRMSIKRGTTYTPNDLMHTGATDTVRNVAMIGARKGRYELTNGQLRLAAN